MATGEATDQIWEKWIDKDEKERVRILQASLLNIHTAFELNPHLNVLIHLHRSIA